MTEFEDVKAGTIKNKIKAMGFSTRADSYSRAKGRGAVRVTQHVGSVHILVDISVPTLPSELDTRAEDIQIAEEIAEELVSAGYCVEADPKARYSLTVRKARRTG